MTTAIGLACICAGIACLLGVVLVGRVRRWWQERQYDPKLHRGDLWLWEVEMRKRETHE